MFCKPVTRSLFAMAVLASAVAAQAVTIDLVPVGNPGNAADPSTGKGSVPYSYQMGKFEVTNAQYCEFLNATLPSINSAETGTVLANDTYGLYNRSMETTAYGGINYNPQAATNLHFTVKSGCAAHPVNYVSWYDAIRFVNWLQSGSTESGTYTITGGGKNSGTVVIPSATTRASWESAHQHWVLPTDSEWYKAAYHKNDGNTGNYWLFSTATNSEPYSDNPESLDYPANSANYRHDDGIPGNGVNDGYAVDSPYLTDVGAYGQSLSPYGTLDQGGNVWEWIEDSPHSTDRAVRGGSAFSWPAISMCALYPISDTPELENNGLGFRVASVPEPGSLAMLAGSALLGLLYWRRRRTR